MKSVILNGLLVVVFSATAAAQVFKPIDLSKQADIGNQSVNLPDVNLQTESRPTRSLPSSPLSNLQPRLKNVQTRDLDLKTLDLSSITTKTLPQQNFTAKRAAVSDQVHRQALIKTAKAPIKNREIRPFTPGGEEELKQQFQAPP